MNKFKLEAYKEEFPFLKDIMSAWDATEVDSVRVKRADEEMLNLVPEEYFRDGSKGETHNWDRVSFVFGDKIAINAVALNREIGSNYAHEQTKFETGETILEALSRVENPDDVTHVVWETRKYSDWSGQDVVRQYSVTVYKPPKGVKFSDLIREAREAALREVQAEVSF